MKHTNIKWRRITASLLALVMIITSLPVNLLAYANDPPPPDYGIGVSNNAYADNDTDYNNYQIKFYYYAKADNKKDAQAAVDDMKAAVGGMVDAIE